MSRIIAFYLPWIDAAPADSGEPVGDEVVNYLVTRLLPARTLPKMDFSGSGIPDECRTLVIVPMMLTNEERIMGRGGKA